MLIQPLLRSLYANPMMAAIKAQQTPAFPWISLGEVMLDKEFSKVGTTEFIRTIDLASEKGYVQIDWKIPFSNSKIRFLEPGYLMAAQETILGIRQ